MPRIDSVWPRFWRPVLVSLAVLATDLCAANAQSIERITTTATRSEMPSALQPFVTATIDRDQIEQVAPAHIEELLRQVAGSGMHRGNGVEYLPALRSEVFAGAGACGGILTAEDGIPLRAAGFCNINELFEAHTEHADAIEVVKGPGSAFYGSNALHGVINVINRVLASGQGQAAFDFGSFGYKRARVATATDLGAGTVSVMGTLLRDSGYREKESVSQEKLTVKYNHERQGYQVQSGMTYIHLDQETAGYITGSDSYKDRLVAQQNANPEAFREARALRLWSRHQWQLNNGSELTVTPYLRDQSMDFLMHFLPGTPLEENAQQGFGVQSLWQYQLTQNWQWNLGLDTEYTRGELRQSQQSETTGSAFLVETVPVGKHYDYAVDAFVLAPFAHLQWQYQAWLVTLGVRAEYMDYDYRNHMLAGRTREDGTVCGFGGCRYSRPASGSDSFNNVSPKFGVSYALDDRIRVYFNWSEGFRAPQATELYRLQRDQQIADLDSESARNLELGLKGFSTGLGYTLALYRMEKDNVILRDADFFNINGGRTRHQGIELELDYALSDTLSLVLASTYAKHTYRNNSLSDAIDIKGNDIDSAPRRMANLRLDWQPLDSARVSLEWQHMGAYYTDAENLHRYAGHDLLNLRSQWRIGDAVTLSARINNLLDKAYAERADYTSFTGDRYFPGRPRQFSFTLDYQW